MWRGEAVFCADMMALMDVVSLIPSPNQVQEMTCQQLIKEAAKMYPDCQIGFFFFFLKWVPVIPKCHVGLGGTLSTTSSYIGGITSNKKQMCKTIRNQVPKNEMFDC